MTRGLHRRYGGPRHVVLFAAWTAVSGALFLAGATGAARADCVGTLAVCATACDRELKPQDPDRPQCAQGCISDHQRCTRIEVLRSSTGGPIFNSVKGKAVAE
ncbi:MAG: hypothetical protein ACRED5_00600 [Propylenella sp.]